MDKSVFGSAIKTYPSKTNRVSRSYRQSSFVGQKNIFGDNNSEELFDKLLNEEKIKYNSNKENINSKFNRVTNYYKNDIRTKHSTALKSIHNNNDLSRQMTHLSIKSTYKHATSIYDNYKKENIQNLRSGLYISDSDSADNSEKSFSHTFNLDIKNDSTIKCKRQKKSRTSRQDTIKLKRLNSNRKKRFRMYEYQTILKDIDMSINKPLINNQEWEICKMEKPIFKLNDINLNAKGNWLINNNTSSNTISSINSFEHRSCENQITKSTIRRKLISTNKFEEKIKVDDSSFKNHAQSIASEENYLCKSHVLLSASNHTLDKTDIENKFNSIFQKSSSPIFNPVSMSTPEFSKKNNMKSFGGTSKWEINKNMEDSVNYKGNISQEYLDSNSKTHNRSSITGIQSKINELHLSNQNSLTPLYQNFLKSSFIQDKFENIKILNTSNHKNDDEQKQIIEMQHKFSLSPEVNNSAENCVKDNNTLSLLYSTCNKHKNTSLNTMNVTEIPFHSYTENQPLEINSLISEEDHVKNLKHKNDKLNLTLKTNISQTEFSSETVVILTPHSEIMHDQSNSDTLLTNVECSNENQIHNVTPIISKNRNTNFSKIESNLLNSDEKVSATFVKTEFLSCIDTELHPSSFSSEVFLGFDSNIENANSSCRDNSSIISSNDDISKPLVKNCDSTNFTNNCEKVSSRYEQLDVNNSSENVLENITSSECVFSLPYQHNFTQRKKKKFHLPILNEEETENENNISYNKNSFLENLSNRSLHKSTFSQSLYLAKGKKWRRSFITLKNIRDFGFNKELLDEVNKGRCWKTNIENLISINDASMISQENENSSIIRSSHDKHISTLEGNDSISKKRIPSQRPRLSYYINVSTINKNEITNDTVNKENSFARCISDSYRSFSENFDIQAGDCSKNYSYLFTDYSIPNTPKEIVLNYCKQNEPLPFEECFPESILRNCKKIGEGVYGEVFMLKKRSRYSVLKIIPIEGDHIINGERQKKFDEVLSELVIALELSNLKNRSDFYTNCFAEVRKCWCVYGKYPQTLISLWKEYDVEKGSDNDSPKIFKDNQLYLILELNHGGEDLESFTFNNSHQALSVFNQVANALAVAEEAFMFEHRDLHWGNVLVSKCKNKEITFITRDEKRTIKLYGVKATIIDYTLSRISLKNHTFYNDIGRDPELFTAEGDFQFDVYRLMKDEVKNIWDRFVPKTNIFWLYYLLDKMINEVRYRRGFTKVHQLYLEKLQKLFQVTMNYKSCCDLIKNSSLL